MSHYQLEKIENLFHKSNRYQTKEFNIWSFSICHCILNFKTLRKKKLRTCMFLPVRLSAKKINLFQKNMICDFVLKKCHFQSGLVRDHHNGTLFVFFSRVSFSLDVLEKILIGLVYLSDRS